MFLSLYMLAKLFELQDKETIFLENQKQNEVIIEFK